MSLQVSLLFLPFLVLNLGWVVVGTAAFDLSGLAAGWKYFDHAGHLAGLGSGVVYAQYMKSQAKKNRLQQTRRSF